MARSSLPPGYRFRPTDVELVMFYLKKKVLRKKLPSNIISELDIYKHEPWDLPDKSCLLNGDLKWYFLCPREKKYGSGDRTNRATDRGYWKTTGKDRPVPYNDRVVGMIKTLVFHIGKAPRGDRTDWVMHEYRLQDKAFTDNQPVLDSFVLCAIFHKDGPGPRNGAQYGAPFVEEEWTDDEEDNSLSTPANMCTPTIALPVNPSNSVATCSYAPEGQYGGSSSEMHSFSTVPSGHNGPLSVPENNVTLTNVSNAQIPQIPEDDILSMLANFTEDENIISNEVINEIPGENYGANAERAAYPGEYDIYHGLGDLDGSLLNADGSSLHNSGCDFSEMPPSVDDPFLELNDLATPLDFPAELALTVPANANGFYASPDYFWNYQQSGAVVDPSNPNVHVPGPNDIPILPP